MNNRPGDFDDYWRRVLDELKVTAISPEVEDLPLRSTDYATAYSVHLSSIGPYRIFAHMSIPRGQGPFPARYYLPRYGSTVEPIPQGAANPQRAQYVTFSVAVRGQRGANQPFEASFPGLLTHGIDDPMHYVYRGIVADCCRGLEFLSAHEAVDQQKLVAIGTDLALITASLCPQVTHVVCTPTVFYAAGDLAPRSEAYPVEEINDYFRHYPAGKDDALRTLSYFDLRWFAPGVRAETLVVTGTEGEILDPPTLRPLLDSVAGEVEVHATEHSSYRDGLFVEKWLARKLGLGDPILPEHWQ